MNRRRMMLGWDREESQLEQRAEQVRDRLDLAALLGRIGRPVLTGSAALHVMVARDIDLTVIVDDLAPRLEEVTQLGAALALRSDVRVVTFRNDTGRWNVDQNYPDGLYLFIECTDDLGNRWTLDIWFVDKPDEQPDLRHLTTYGPRIDPERQAAILAIKRATKGVRPDGTRLASFEIYQAVLDRGIRTPEEFAQHLR